MPRRIQSLTESTYPFVLAAYKDLGALLLCLLEARWKLYAPISDFFFAAVPPDKDGGGSDATWRRWKSPHTAKKGDEGKIIYGKYPERIFQAIEWAKSGEYVTGTKKVPLLSEGEGAMFEDFFEMLIEWDRPGDEPPRLTSQDDIANEISQLMSFALDIAGFDTTSELLYIDRVTYDVCGLEAGEPGGKDYVLFSCVNPAPTVEKWIRQQENFQLEMEMRAAKEPENTLLQAALSDEVERHAALEFFQEDAEADEAPWVRKERNEKGSDVRDAMLRLLVTCNTLLNEIQNDVDLVDMSFKDEPYSIRGPNRGSNDTKKNELTYHQYKALRTALLLEADQLFARIFTHIRDRPQRPNLKNDGSIILTELIQMAKKRLRAKQRIQEEENRCRKGESPP